MPLWVVLLVSSCGSTITPLDPVIALPDADSEPPAEVNLPKQELTASVLGDLLVADLAYYRDDIATSLEILEKTAFETRDVRIAEMVTVRAIGYEEFEIASNTADLWVELNPTAASAWNAKGIALVATSELDEAVASFNNVIEYSRDPDLSIQRISGWLAQKLPPPTAYAVFEKLLALHPDNVKMHLALIELAGWVKEAAEIDALFDAAFRLAGPADSVAEAKFSLYLQTGRQQEAEIFAVDFLAQNADAKQLRETYARYLTQAGLYMEAVAQYQALAAPDKLLRIGTLHQRANYLDRAEASFKDYFETEPEGQDVFVGLAEVNLMRKNYAQAQEWIAQITSQRLAFDKIVLSARYLAGAESIEAGVDRLRQYRPQSDRELIGIYIAINEIYRENGRYDESMQTLNAALRQYPQNTSLLLARTYTAAELDMIALVERDVEAVLKIHPNNPSALNALGYTLADQTDRYEEAFELIERALDQRPHDPYILDSMGWVQFKLGDYEDAIANLTLALERRYDPVMIAHLGEVYWTLGQKNKARGIWNSGLKDFPDSEYILEAKQRLTGQ